MARKGCRYVPGVSGMVKEAKEGKSRQMKLEKFEETR